MYECSILLLHVSFIPIRANIILTTLFSSRYWFNRRIGQICFIGAASDVRTFASSSSISSSSSSGSSGGGGRKEIG